MKVTDAKKKALIGGSIVSGAILLYISYRIGCQRGVDVTHDAIKNVCDKETFDKVDAALKR